MNIDEVLNSISDRVALQPDTLTKAKAALDDYRLLAAEVEKLREVARVAERVISNDFLTDVRLEDLERLRDALAKREEEEKAGHAP